MTAGAPAAELRPVGPGDEPFLRRLYAGLRASEFAPLGFQADVLEDLLAMQFVAQDRSYRERFTQADFDLVIVEASPAGRLYVDRSGNPIHVIDITLAPEYRNRGIGTGLMRELVGQAHRSSRWVTLNVARGNHALALYRRLGFSVTAQDDVYLTLECRRTVS